MVTYLTLLCQLTALVAVSANPLGPQGNVNLAARDVLFPRAVTTSCNADNCARAVTGTSSVVKPPRSSRLADCNSFLSTTVTPVTTTTVTVYTSTETDVSLTSTTSTSTSTSIISTTTTTNAAMKKRQAPITTVTGTPTAVPSYASSCSGSARYSSACSCFMGATSTTVTASTSTVTVTVSKVTTTVTSSTVSSVTTTTTTTTVVATATSTYVLCDRNASGSGQSVLGVGGCSSNCYCDYGTDGNAYCVNDYSGTFSTCSANSDCTSGQVCSSTVGNSCDASSPAVCSSTYKPGSSKRDLSGPLAIAGDAKKLRARQASEADARLANRLAAINAKQSS